MENKNIWGIIYLCIAINQKAIQIYTKLFEIEEIAELPDPGPPAERRWGSPWRCW